MNTSLRYFLLAALLLMLPSCLEMEEALTIYLTPNDSLDFVLFLDDIRSIESNETARKKEEKKFLADFRGGRFLRTDLVALGGKRLKFELARRKSPYAAVISGHFDKIEPFWKTFEFNADRDGKTASFNKEGTKRRLVFRLPAAATRSQSTPEVRQDFARRMKLIVTAGRFTESKGFKLSEDGRTASLDETLYLEMRRKADPFELVLAW